MSFAVQRDPVRENETGGIRGQREKFPALAGIRVSRIEMDHGIGRRIGVPDRAVLGDKGIVEVRLGIRILHSIHGEARFARF
jgi:hypothetical protein